MLARRFRNYAPKRCEMHGNPTNCDNNVLCRWNWGRGVCEKR